MTSISPASIDRAPSKPRLLSRFALRRRAAAHPMAMFALVAGAAFAAMTFAASSDSTPDGTRIAARAGLASDAASVRQSARASDLACKGQAWGAEDEACLKSILTENGGRADRAIRKLAFNDAASKTF